ncbi:glycogen debranching enzyme isoform X2 [Diabrotica virgifera virgifera]|uniref:Glycogen debranching enzyme n=1 Tax=Diabrotica virgifera virgifera TaxID=50390 RepID=A0ABM5JP26_DIAVI|nr:glycogen debranching enzyme isoform X2 [Diabrotica virgifera virgifera]
MLWLIVRFTFYGVIFVIQLTCSITCELFRLTSLWVVLGLLTISDGINTAVSSTSQEEEKSDKSSSNKPKQQFKGGKVRQRPKKLNEDPTFSTSLSTPIEDIIEETINEEVAVNKKKGKSSKKQTEELPVKKEKPTKDLDDDIGYSFFKVKTVSKGNPEAKPKKQVSVDLNEDNTADDIGFSFLPVKEKGKKYKSKSNPENKDQELTLNAVVDQTLRKAKYDTSKPSIIEHYKKRTTDKAFSKKAATKFESPSVSTIVEKRLLYESKLKSETKESKKVTSSISFASIVSNATDAPSGSDIEQNSQLLNGPKPDIQQHIFESLESVKSSAESVEVIDDSNSEYQNSQSTNFETIKEKLNTLLDEDSDFNQTQIEQSNVYEIDQSSKHSSVYIVGSNEVLEESSSTQDSYIGHTGFEQEPEQTFSQKTLEASIDNRFITDASILEKSTSTEAFLSFERHIESQDLTHSLESSNYYQNNYSQLNFDNQLQNSSESHISDYSYSQNQQSLSSSDFSRDYNSTDHSFTELVDNCAIAETYQTDTNYFQSNSELSQQFERVVSNQFISTESFHSTSQSSFQELVYENQNLVTENNLESSEYIENSTKESIPEPEEQTSPQFIEAPCRQEPGVEQKISCTENPTYSSTSDSEATSENTSPYKVHQTESSSVGFKKVVSEEKQETTYSRRSQEDSKENRTFLVNEQNQVVDEYSLKSEEQDRQEAQIDDYSNQQEIKEENQVEEQSLTSEEEDYQESKEYEFVNVPTESEEQEELAEENRHSLSSNHLKKETKVEEEFAYSSAKEDSQVIETEVVENGTDFTTTEQFAQITTTKVEEEVYASDKDQRQIIEEESVQNEDNLIKTKQFNQATTSEEHHRVTEKETLIEQQNYFLEEERKLPSVQNQLEEYSEYEEDIGIEYNNIMSEKAQQVRVLTLNDHEHQECTLYRIEKNWVIQFRVGPSLFGRKVYLYCNYPSKTNNQLNEFRRNKYQQLQWCADEGCENADDTGFYSQIKAELAGSFHYFFTYEKGENLERQGSGYFLVDPVLKYGNNEDLPLDCIQCQTVLAKCLGSFSTWENKLQVAKESGYNMIHFTPIQELGESNSSYSLSEQLKLNPVFKKSDGKMPTFEEVEQFTAKLRKDWKVTSICDIVLNHTANESKWIQEHPEVTYNCVNCPYMRPAYLLDAAFDFFSSEVKRGVYEDRGIPPDVTSEDHLNAIRYHFRASILDELKIHELFTCDTKKLIANFLSLARSGQPNPPKSPDSKPETEELKLIQDPEYRRLETSVDMKLALKLYNIYWSDTFDEDSRLKKCAEQLKNKLDELNNRVIDEVNDHLSAAIENVIAGIRYYRIQHDGPKFKDITIKTPLVYRYFTDYGSPKTLKEFEDIMYSDKGRFLMAHNGWVMESDPLRNFAAPDTKVYIRRELIAWGDSVKLRFGDKPEDCPFLWDHMKKYVEETARIFDGVRLDNCHSTPIPVAEYLLDCARRVRPDLYVVAELFTNSDMTDNIFVNRLGITSLIREAMSAWDSHEEGRLVYRYGGSPVGSFYQPNVRPLVPSVAHALFLDQTHDNPSPVEKRSVFDLLPSTALINMACCASGSNRGYDELVPHHIHVVDEDREYTEWTATDNLSVGNLRYVTHKCGILKAKKAINDLHFLLGKQGFNQVYVDQMDADIVAVTRHCPVTHQSYILVAFTAFGHPNEDAGEHQRGIKPLRFEGNLDEIVLEATLSHVKHKSGGSKYTKWHPFIKDCKWINGLPDYQVCVKEHIQVPDSDIFEKVDSGTKNVTQLNFKNFKPGSVVVIKSSLPEPMRAAIKTVRTLISSISLAKPTELATIVNKMTLADMNRALYRCGQEERDEGFGFDTYNIPSFGSMVYAGLQGFMSLLANIRPNNDLGHPMCANLRDGNWMIEFIWKRLKLDPGTKELGDWIERNTKSFENIPRYLVPCYFDIVVTGLYLVLLEKTHKLMSNFVKNGSTFVRGLALGSVQFGAYIKSADLPTLSPNLAPPKPPSRKIDNDTVQACVTLSAGLPHFSVGYMRNWGRDTFIALRGLFILTGRYQEAREHILGYAACMRHGLIPNLLDGGRNSRFNCRDAIWWWLYCIKEYVNEAPEGIKILSDKVSRIFPTDDATNQPPGAVDQPLYDVIQEGLKIHFQGLAFRERNAGRQIDEHMVDAGFNNQIGVHPETGFVFGGNKWNCGTWMDKMGSSDKAGNRGKPATPRDGSAVELIGLSKSVISWLAKLSEDNKYPYKGVERVSKSGTKTNWTFKEWALKIQNNFEKHFWVNSKPTDGEIRPDLVNKRGIYKDSHGSSLEYTDFQLRCNFPVAMVAAPELFTPSRAWEALIQAEKYLLGPLGMKTLDPEDWAYKGDYDNSNQSEDPSVSHGFNYHQGPEWVWPIGFFLRAKLIFAAQNGALRETVASTKLILSKHFVELQTSDWRGLPELTNKDGAYCNDSSRTQAWSMSCVLEVLHDLKKIESSIDLLGN